MGQLKVKVKHAPVTDKVLSKMSKIMCGFGLDCVKLSGYSGRCPVPAHLIKSVDIEKNSQSTNTSYWSARGQTTLHVK